jgi:uncharacterized membrane protein (DUF4010 family)
LNPELWWLVVLIAVIFAAYCAVKSPAGTGILLAGFLGD